MHRVSTHLVSRMLLLALATANAVSGADEIGDTATPQNTFAEYSKALREKNWKRAFALMTPAYQDFQLHEMAFGLGMAEREDVTEKHQDAEKLKRLQERVKEQQERDIKLANDGQPIDQGRRQREQQANHRAFIEALKDREQFYSAAMKILAGRLDDDDLPDGKLNNLKVEKDRARGTMARHLKSIEAKDGKEIERRTTYQSPVYFKKSGKNWLIDAPTSDEMRTDVEQILPGFGDEQ